MKHTRAENRFGAKEIRGGGGDRREGEDRRIGR
jgi:hypothetical protein